MGHKTKENQAMGLDELLVEVDSIRESLEDLRSNVSIAKQCFRSALSCPFSDEDNKNKLRQATEKIQPLSRNIRSMIKNFYTNYTSNTYLSKTLQNAAITQHSSLLKEFLVLMHDYQKIQVEYQDKRRAQMEVTAQIVGINNNDVTDSVFIGNLLHLTNEAQMSLRQVQERHDEFIKLQESVQEVHDLFFEVGLIVDSQGDMVERIEKYVNEAVSNTDRGAKVLLEAKRQKKKHRKRKIRLLLAGAGVVAITVAIMIL